jgi:hypothetical protein
LRTNRAILASNNVELQEYLERKAASGNPPPAG